jgi:beta-barrel assembly-enhancing protease
MTSRLFQLPILMYIGLLALASPLHAQDFDHYERLQCAGAIPPALLGSTGAKYQTRLAELERSKEEDEQQAKEEFLLESSFFLDGLLRGGKVIFNDPVSEYLNDLKNFILRDDAELRDKIQIYTLKSPYVNAFATNEGVVLVTTGLLAHARNEATVAFVLCHEIQHYLRKHGMERFLATTKKKKERVYQQDEEALALETCRYSRDQEMEADTAGLRVFLTTGYSSAAVEDAYDLLLYAPYHFDINAVWDKSFFESPNLEFPAVFHLDSINAIMPDSSEDDTRQTHPNVSKRRATSKGILAAHGMVDGPLFILGEERFNEVNTICRFEQSAIFLQAQRYEAAIFNSYLLLRQHPKSYFLRRVIVQALYGLSRYHNENEYGQVHLEPGYVEGGHQPLHFFFDRIEKPALNVLAIRLASQLMQNDPQDRVLADIHADLLKDMQFRHPEKMLLLEKEDAPAGFYDSLIGFQQVPATVIRVLEEKDDQGNEEYIEERGFKPVKRDYSDNYYRYGLADFMRDSIFTRNMRDAVAKGKIAKAEAMQLEGKLGMMYRPEKQPTNVQGYRLGIDKLIVVNPTMVIYNEYKAIKVDRLASEVGKADYRDKIETLGKRLGLGITILDPAYLKANEVDKFNEINGLKDYVDGISGDSEVPMINFDQELADSLIAKFQTRHLAYMFLVKSKERFRYKYGHILMGVMFWPIGIPFLATRWMFPNRSLIVGNAVFDLKENRMLMVEYRRVKGRANRTRMESTLYNTLFQITTESKSKRN